MQQEESAKGQNTECTIKRQRNRGAIYSKMTIDKRQIRAESAPMHGVLSSDNEVKEQFLGR